GSEIRDLKNAGIQARNICMFEKTAREIADQTGMKMLYSAALESTYSDCETRSPSAVTGIERNGSPAIVAFETSCIPVFRQIRIGGGGNLMLDDACQELGDRGFVYLILGSARPTAETMKLMAAAECRSGPCISIPALVVQRRSGGNVFIRPDVERMNSELANGLLPAALLVTPLA